MKTIEQRVYKWEYCGKTDCDRSKIQDHEKYCGRNPAVIESLKGCVGRTYTNGDRFIFVESVDEGVRPVMATVCDADGPNFRVMRHQLLTAYHLEDFVQCPTAAFDTYCAKLADVLEAIEGGCIQEVTE